MVARSLPGLRPLIAALWLSAVATAAYWIDFFTGGDIQSTVEECYLAFEAAFPAADGWMALAAVLCAEGLRRRREWAVLWGTAAGSAFIYLGLMDVLYNLEHGMYARMSGQMAVESLINLWCFTFGPFLMAYVWRHRAVLAVA